MSLITKMHRCVYFNVHNMLRHVTMNDPNPNPVKAGITTVSKLQLKKLPTIILLVLDRNTTMWKSVRSANYSTALTQAPEANNTSAIDKTATATSCLVFVPTQA